MNIHHFLVSDEKAASPRYRATIPGRALAQRGHQVSFTFCFDLPKHDVDVLVLHKYRLFPGMSDLVLALKKRGTRVVYDICDDHFHVAKREVDIRGMAALADVITGPTPMMREVVRTHLNRDAYVVQDPYEFPEVPPRFAPSGKPRLLWYGSVNNLRALFHEWPRLQGCEVTIITDAELWRGRVSEVIDTSPYPEPVDWSIEAMQQGFDKTDMVILPVEIGKAKKLSKSPNRMVEAIRQGRFVVASPLPEYQRFAEWMWVGDIRDGVDWAMAHPDEVPGRIRAAQDYIRDAFSPDRAADQWLEAFNAA